MADRFGFCQSDMTNEGWADYQRQLGEIAAQRWNRTSQHASRVHCCNGYVDVISHRYENGSSVDIAVDDFRAKVRSEGAYIYDYNYQCPNGRRRI